MKITHTLAAFAITLSTALILTNCGSTDKQEQEAHEEEEHHEEGIVEFTQAQYQTVGVTLGGIEKRHLSGLLKVNGLLDVPPQNQVSISVPFGGILKNTELLQGMWVNKNQVIAHMEHPDYIQLQQDYLDASSQLPYMAKEYQRQETLNKENASATKTFERTSADYNALRSRVEALRIKLSLININASDLTPTSIQRSIPVISPIGGYVTEVNANIGKFVQPNEVIFEIIDTRHLHVELMVFEKDVPKLKEGQKVRFTLANEVKEREAEVHLIGREISPERTVRVHCHLYAEDKNLLPGMYLKATIETSAAETNALPNEAIVSADGKSYCFVQETTTTKQAGPQYRFRMIEITTGITDEGYTEVMLPDTFDPGSKNIVLTGAYDLLSKMNNSEEEGGHAH